MAQPTSISVSVDNTEYSRYETGKETISATIQLSGGSPYSGETIQVALVKARRSRDAVVATSSFTASGTAPYINTVQFYLPDIVDQDMINLVRHGKYFVKAYSPVTAATAVIGSGSGAPVTLTTVDTGTAANSWTVTVAVPGGTSALSYTLVGTALTINLAVSGGVPVAAANTQALVAGLINSTLAGAVTASYSGSGNLSLSVAQTSTAFTGGRDEVSGSSSDFNVRVVTVERLKKDYLFGIPAYAGQARFVRNQPTNITGLQVTEVSPQHTMGVFTLAYTYHIDGDVNATASIGAGANGTVLVTATGTHEGTAGNSWSIRTVVPVGTSALSASAASNVITVNLAVTAGVPTVGANTATLISAAINLITGFTAVASGTGASEITTALGPIAFTGGTDRYIRQLSWNGGPITSVTGPGTYILRKGSGTSSVSPLGGISGILSTMLGNEYAIVRVQGTSFLPTANAADEILVEQLRLDDETIARYLDQSIAWVENEILAAYVEPTNVVTDRDPTTIQFAAGINAPNPIFTDPDYDFIVGPLTYFPPRQGSDWVDIQTPFPQLIRVDSLFGSIANTRVIDIDLDWIQFHPSGGLIQLVPFNQSIAFDFLGLIWVNALRGAAALPNFWHFNIIAGMRDCPPEVQELIAKKAAMEALMMLGMALRPGVGSVSLGRDGVSQSVSYTTQAKYGPYTGVIQGMMDWMEQNLPRFRSKYRGSLLTVV